MFIFTLMFKTRYKYIILTLLIVFSLNSVYANKPENELKQNVFDITDGPYIFFNNDYLTVKWIKNNKLKQKELKNTRLRYLNRKFDIHLHPSEFDSIANFNQEYSTSEKIIVISDIHGQYDITLQLLKNHRVIDSKNNWAFGKGHLIILGDIFDRGDKVTEVLWLVYNLEKQAGDVGGKVHYLIGNHELMVLQNDLRYVNEKYILSSALLGTNYTDLFMSNSVLGKWLHQRPVIMKINNILITHAGISPEITEKNFSISEINETFTETIFYKSKEEIYSDSTLKLLSSSKGPVWYRGYFSKEFKQDKINTILKYYNANRIIIGHTSLPNISQFYNGKILGVDSSIKLGNYGEVLIIENDNFYRGTLNGGKIKIPIN